MQVWGGSAAHALKKGRIDNGGERIDWLHIPARNKNGSMRKARAVRGCYKYQVDTITAAECGIEYTYKAI